MTGGLLAIGECMIELSGGENALYRQGFAGDTLNTAWHARRHLPDGIPVGYFTALGTDTMSARMREFLNAGGIGTDRIVTVADRRPGLYMIEQKDGDRHFTYWRDRSAARLMAEDEDVLRAAFAGQAMLYFSGITLAILSSDARARLHAALGAAKAEGARLAFDPNIRPALWEDAAVMRRVIEGAAALSDIVLPSFDDEAVHFGDADPQATCRRYAAAGAAEIVVKDGPKPVTLWQEGEIAIFDVPPLARVVDATGAGDGFNGGYLAARMSGVAASGAVAQATRVSAGVLGHHGAIPS
ncbi:sugar kinase [Acidimangrovimonas sediminis]|uniref:sugar kinase n=1 Tax=Acidimangrovimonas sediminis TaxID=2056283 RepID=UPI000C7FD528|nr:sugar kinase [Acidimangrovimonas sediminis]